MSTRRYLPWLLLCSASAAWCQTALPAIEVEAIVTTDLGTQADDASRQREQHTLQHLLADQPPPAASQRPAHRQLFGH